MFFTKYVGASAMLSAATDNSLSLIRCWLLLSELVGAGVVVVGVGTFPGPRPNPFVWIALLAIIFLVWVGVLFTFAMALLAAFLFARVVGFRLAAASALPLNPRRALKKFRLAAPLAKLSPRLFEDICVGEDPPRWPLGLRSQQVLFDLGWCGSLGFTRLTAVSVNEDVDEVRLNLLLANFNGLPLNCCSLLADVVVVELLFGARWMRFSARLDLLLLVGCAAVAAGDLPVGADLAAAVDLEL